MDATFWHERWAEGRIGFHEGRPNTYLEAHAALLRGRVLVPLCGKSEDLAYLAGRGHEVVGVELVEDAVRAFFVEHGLEPEVAPLGPFQAYRAGALTLLAGDFFALTGALLGPFDTFYDRAALIALPAAMRPGYAAHVQGLAPRGLLVTVDYPDGAIEGPPFAVRDDEVRRLYPGVQLLSSARAAGARLAEVTEAVERAYRVDPPLPGR